MNLKKGRWVMETRVKVFTYLLNLGHEKVTKTLSAMGMFDGREVVFALPSSSSDIEKKAA